MRVIFCALGMSIAHEEKHFGNCDLWFIICCRLAVILLLIRRYFAANSLLLRFGVVCSPFVFRYFPLFSVVERRNNGEQTNVERISNESRTEIERRSNGERTENERRTSGERAVTCGERAVNERWTCGERAVNERWNRVWPMTNSLSSSVYRWAFLLGCGCKVTAFLNTGYHLMPDNAG